ncbi:MAG TPA: tagaturonate epimerase family protein [Phycisphaerae bacterium]|nr:tagaturonate epimerase family protein [Phycisphaerae bacterium]
MKDQLEKITGLDLYESSIVATETATYFLGRRGTEKLVGQAGGPPCLPNVERAGELAGRCVCVGPCDHANAAGLRELLPWAGPKCVGLATSAGLGDRLGLATPGHLRAMRAEGGGLAVFLAQQSIREMTRTRRTPEQVMDCATWGVLQDGWREGFGSDADHLQHPEDIDATVAAGFTMFTIDPGLHVANDADRIYAPSLDWRASLVDLATLEATVDDLRRRYVGKAFPLATGGSLRLDDQTFLRALIKYGNAIAHTVRMYRHLKAAATREFELEVSVDETDSPTSPAEHFFFAGELKRLGVEWVSMAPRYLGRFEKGVDYLGDLDAFRASFARHVAVMRTVGPYKMSIHSGSDKFSIYPIIAELTDGLVHLKTAGTSYLEALRAVAHTDPALFREVLQFARDRYELDRRTYHVSADLEKVPTADDLAFGDVDDAELTGLLDQFDTRQVLHVTFGSVLTADGGERFRTRLYAALGADEEAHYAALAAHLGRHVAPFAPHAKG